MTEWEKVREEWKKEIKSRIRAISLTPAEKRDCRRELLRICELERYLLLQEIHRLALEGKLTDISQLIEGLFKTIVDQLEAEREV